jgi:hypothetical protein
MEKRANPPLEPTTNLAVNCFSLLAAQRHSVELNRFAVALVV